jgi:hypothetical protein
MKIKYVGLKDEETAFSHKTGIVWTPGAVHEVADKAMCVQMLQHPDVFAEDTEGATLADGTVAKEQGDKVRTTITLADGTVKDLVDLDKEALHALAKELNVQVHHAAGPAKVIDALFAAFPG